MYEIKFNEDYEKLPLVWNGTQATLLGVYRESVETIKKRYTAFWKKDTKIRGLDKFYCLHFKDALILIFLHHNTGELFSTIRKDKDGKFEYYVDSVGETFKLIKC